MRAILPVSQIMRHGNQGGGTVLSNRATIGTYIGADGLIHTAQPKVVRPNYAYQNGLWVRQGNLLEAAATNYEFPSATGSGWTLTPATDGALSPDGTPAKKLIFSGANTYSGATTCPSGPQTLSCFFKWDASYTPFTFFVNNLNVRVDADPTTKLPILSSQFNNPCGIIVLANGWFRLWVYSANTALTNPSINIGNPAGSGISIYVWGFQLEAGPLSSYFPTNGAVATRAAD